MLELGCADIPLGGEKECTGERGLKSRCEERYEKEDEKHKGRD